MLGTGRQLDRGSNAPSLKGLKRNRQIEENPDSYLSALFFWNCGRTLGIGGVRCFLQKHKQEKRCIARHFCIRSNNTAVAKSNY